MSKLHTISESIGNKEQVRAETKVIYKNYPLHRHEYYELELILGGTGIMVLNGKNYALKKGTITFTTPNDFHEIKNVKNLFICNISFSALALNQDFMAKLIAIKAFASVLDENSFERHCRLGSLLEEAHKTNQSSEYVYSLLDCYLIQLISFVSLIQDVKTKKASNTSIQNALTYLKLNFHENPTLEQVAKYVHLSPNYFSSLFKSETGQSLKLYLAGLKLNYSANLLKTTNLSVTDICFACGYTSLPNFLKSFKNKYGTSPLKYRKATKLEV